MTHNERNNPIVFLIKTYHHGQFPRFHRRREDGLARNDTTIWFSRGNIDWCSFRWDLQVLSSNSNSPASSKVWSKLLNCQKLHLPPWVAGGQRAPLVTKCRCPSPRARAKPIIHDSRLLSSLRLTKQSAVGCQQPANFQTNKAARQAIRQQRSQSQRCKQGKGRVYLVTSDNQIRLSWFLWWCDTWCAKRWAKVCDKDPCFVTKTRATICWSESVVAHSFLKF